MKNQSAWIKCQNKPATIYPSHPSLYFKVAVASCLCKAREFWLPGGGHSFFSPIPSFFFGPKNILLEDRAFHKSEYLHHKSAGDHRGCNIRFHDAHRDFQNFDKGNIFFRDSSVLSSFRSFLQPLNCSFHTYSHPLNRFSQSANLPFFLDLDGGIELTHANFMGNF